MPLRSGTSREVVSDNIRELIHSDGVHHDCTCPCAGQPSRACASGSVVHWNPEGRLE
jgi:hypothetical protein